MKKNWLYNKNVIISGASGGIGFAISKLLIEKYDCNVLGICRNEEKVKKAKNTLGEKADKFSYVLFDVSKKENWAEFASTLEKSDFSPDILINNAGLMLPFESFEKVSDSEIEKIISTNLMSVIYGTKALLPILKKSTSPAIINISSAAGNCPVVGETMYCTTKFAVKGFTESLRQDYKKSIYVAGVYPGFIKTDLFNDFGISDKNLKLITKMMMPVNKAAKKIVKKISKKRYKIVLGYDGRFMSVCGRLFPKITPAIITSVLRKSKLEMFDNIFEENKTKRKK